VPWERCGADLLKFFKTLVTGEKIGVHTGRDMFFMPVSLPIFIKRNTVSGNEERSF
jgi:hypothetical protein